MARRLLNVLAALSLALLIAVTGLWVRSFWTADSMDWEIPDGRAGVFSMGGRFGVGAAHVTAASRPNILRGFRVASVPVHEGAKYSLKPQRSFAGVQAARVIAPGLWAWDVRVPYPLLMPPLALLPSLSLWRRRRIAKRMGAGLCPACGYDLRSTPDRCPECGRPSAYVPVHF